MHRAAAWSGLLLFILAGGCASSSLPKPVRSDRMIDDGWRFTRRDVGGGGQSMALDDSSWAVVNLPHTWNAQDGQDGGSNYYRGAGWYRRLLAIDPADAGKSFFLRFDGAATVTDVYVNGKRAGQHRGNFGAFCFDVTKLVHVGLDNVVAVRVDNSKFNDVTPLAGDFTIFGGLYRDVHLLVLNPLSVTPLDDASPGVYLKPMHHDADSATVQVLTKLRNGRDADMIADVVCRIRDAKGKLVATNAVRQRVAANSQADAIIDATIEQPRYWDGVRDPYLYRADVEVRAGPVVTDVVTQPLGLRDFNVDPANGFFLNGKRYGLHGVNRHQDRIDKGWAIGPKEHDEDYALIREVGATGVRLSHYEHADYFYQLCDRGGLVVWAELAYINFTGDMPAFGDNAKQQLRELIKQNYNHPSICFWSLYNELSFGKGGDEEKPDQMQMLKDLNALAHELDPSRPTVCGTMLKPSHPANWVTNLTAFNFYYGWYKGNPGDWARELDILHETYSDKSIGISEYGAGASIYQHEPGRVVRPDPRGRWHPEEWQCTVHEAAWKAMKERPWLWGTFAWCMFDFASDGRSEGDHLGRNDKGLVTYDRKIRKDAFYFYKANWSDEAVVHINSRRFNPRPPGRIQVKVYSNCDTVELFMDGNSIGVRNGQDDIFLWDVDLPEGKHKFTAAGSKNGKRYVDDVIWDVSEDAVTTQPAY